MGGIAGLFGLRRRDPHERAGFRLYGAAVAAARAPRFYAALGVPDTLDGRFDMVGLHVFLLIDRLRQAEAPGPALAQSVFDAMFSDMDQNLREMGVGDLTVGKRVRAMWEAFHGRCAAYEGPLEAADAAGLAVVIARNVWRGAPPPPGASEALAREARVQQAHLKAQPLAAFESGAVAFLSDPSAAEAA
ncbi:MAG: ubiquinol-cytochrome C chaperone family protein [Proteobacteria bacterium]|nr:ubiquinol-cytochrome C chaperone family protein [Pseudomonadota bacterium]